MGTKHKKVQQVEQLQINTRKCPINFKNRICNSDCINCEEYQKWVKEYAEELENERKEHR